MHVVWVSEKAEPAGGAERYVQETATLLAGRGVRSTLLYGVAGWMSPSYTSSFDAAFPWVSGKRQLGELEPDVVYLHQAGEPTAVIDAVVSSGVPALRFLHDHALFCPRDHKYRVVGRRTCTDTVGLNCWTCLGVVRKRPEGPIPIRLRTPSSVEAEQRRHMDLDGVVVGSRYMRDHATAHGFDPERVHLNPLYVKPPAELPVVPRKPSEVLFVGGLLRGKGLDVLLEAMAELPERVTLRVVGDGHQRRLFETIAGELRLGSRVRFDGRLEADALARAYAEATVAVVPSRSPETFSLTGAEALAHGTPVVATDIGGVREWLVPEETGLAVPSCDPQALALAIRRIIDDPALGRRLGEAGRARVLHELSPERHVDALMTLFERLVR